jgi:lysophospholipase L1-like esterase
MRALLLSLALAAPTAAQTSAAQTPAVQTPAVQPVEGTPALTPLPTHAIGRVVGDATGYIRQWPGTYFETAATGPDLYFRVGPGEVSLRVTVDNGAPLPLVRPAPGLYRVAGLRAGPHRVRVDVASESQAGPTTFGGFLAGPGTRPARLPRRTRAIEFIGDSHTVGYGNTSPTETCSKDEVWQTTDTARGLAALTAARYGADYQVNAISGRGVVRNYNGFAADPLPKAYGYTLYGQPDRGAAPSWRPQVIAVSLGTNDFSTPLNPGERWPTRDALRADYEASYVRFVQHLRAQHPRAYIVLWSTDIAQGEPTGEIETEVGRVAATLRAAGDRRVGFVPVRGVSFSACNNHPSLADDQLIADTLAAHLDGQRGVWGR